MKPGCGWDHVGLEEKSLLLAIEMKLEVITRSFVGSHGSGIESHLHDRSFIKFL